MSTDETIPSPPSERPRSAAGAAAARRGRVPAHGHPAVRRPREIDSRARPGDGSDKQILLVAQKQADVDDPGAKDLYRLGTVATILQLLKLPDGTVKVLVEGGRARASIEKLHTGRVFLVPK